MRDTSLAAAMTSAYAPGPTEGYTVSHFSLFHRMRPFCMLVELSVFRETVRGFILFKHFLRIYLVLRVTRLFSILADVRVASNRLGGV